MSIETNKECPVKLPNGTPCKGSWFCEMLKIAREDIKTAMENCDPENIKRARQVIRKKEYENCQIVPEVAQVLSNGYHDTLEKCSGEPTISVRPI